VAPSSGSVVLGNQATFAATVTNHYFSNEIEKSSSGGSAKMTRGMTKTSIKQFSVIGATLGGWSCLAPGPSQFDGSYEVAGLPVGISYTVYAEALNGAANPSQFNNALASLCRNAMTDAGWPPLQACIVPAVDISFTTRTRPGP